MKKENAAKGFTLAELLIAMAIVVVMTAIAVPTFGAHLERAREAVDLSNLRGEYSEAMTAIISITNISSTEQTTPDFKWKIKAGSDGSTIITQNAGSLSPYFEFKQNKNQWQSVDVNSLPFTMDEDVTTTGYVTLSFTIPAENSNDKPSLKIVPSAGNNANG